MKKLVLALFLFVAAVAAAIFYFTYYARTAPRAADLLPDSTWLFVQIPDFAKAREQFRTTEAYALWNEPEVQAFLEQPIEALNAALGHSGDTVRQHRDVQRLLDACQGEVFFAVTQIRLLPTPQASVIFGADVKHKRALATLALAEYRRKLQEQNPQATFTTDRYLGVGYETWEIRPGWKLCHGALNSLVVFTLGEDTMRDVIARFKQQPEQTTTPLSLNPKFTDLVNQMPADHALVAYVNAEQIVALVGPLLAFSSQGGASLMQQLGRMQAMGTSVTFHNGAIEDVSQLAYSKPDPKPHPPTEFKTLALTTPATIFYTSATTDPVAEYDGLLELLVSAGKPELSAGVTSFEQTLRNSGVRIRDDLLPLLGPESAILAQWRQGSAYPEVALAVQVSDAAKVRPALDAAMNTLKETALGDDAAFPWDTADYRGLTLHTVHVGGSVLAPTYCVTDKFVILALTPDHARTLVDHAQGAEPTLAANATYRHAIALLPTNGHSYVYCDTKEVFASLYQSARHSLTSMTNEFFALEKLPQTETVAKHLSPYASAALTSRKSETSVTFSPLGKPITAIGGIALGAAVAGPHLSWFAPNLPFSPGMPTMSSGTAFPPPPDENPAAPSQTPPRE